MKRLAKISVLPTDTKQENFVLALADYLDKEFKNNNLKSKKNNSYVKVCLSKSYMDKYDSIVIDCMNGHMYLRGVGCKDKYFGRMSKFNNKRASDAYQCVNYNATRIINRINKIEKSFQEREVVAVYDERSKINRIYDERPQIIKICDEREVKACKIFDERKIIIDERKIICKIYDERKSNTNERKVVVDERRPIKANLAQDIIVKIKNEVTKAVKSIFEKFKLY